MQEPADAAQSPHVTNRERGGRIQRRLDALRISDRQFHETTQIDRKTLRRAVAGDPSVRPNTYRTIEDWLDRLETRAKGDEGLPDELAEDGPRFVEIELEGVYGIARAVVKGPVDDPAAVARAAGELMRQLRAEREAMEREAE